MTKKEPFSADAIRRYTDIMVITPLPHSQALIFDIQRFSLHDGPGIRTTIFFKGCPLRCQWCQNPESLRTRSEIAYYSEGCVRCFTCAQQCPHEAILTSPVERIDHDRCQRCGTCTTFCPTNSLRLVGYHWGVEDLMEEVLRDRAFYEESGGGITLSGGEPLLQHQFLAEFLPRLKKTPIHVTLQTCGHVPWKHFEDVLPYIDLVFYDLKLMDATLHREYTGRDNKLILENFERLAHRDISLQARLPLVPAVTDTLDNISKLANFLKIQGQTSLHCLPYHRLGESKLMRIKPLKSPMITRDPQALDIDRLVQIVNREGIDAVIYD